MSAHETRSKTDLAVALNRSEMNKQPAQGHELFAGVLLRINSKNKIRVLSLIRNQGIVMKSDLASDIYSGKYYHLSLLLKNNFQGIVEEVEQSQIGYRLAQTEEAKIIDNVGKIAADYFSAAPNAITPSVLGEASVNQANAMNSYRRTMLLFKLAEFGEMDAEALVWTVGTVLENIHEYMDIFERAGIILTEGRGFNRAAILTSDGIQFIRSLLLPSAKCAKFPENELLDIEEGLKLRELKGVTESIDYESYEQQLIPPVLLHNLLILSFESLRSFESFRSFQKILEGGQVKSNIHQNLYRQFSQFESTIVSLLRSPENYSFLVNTESGVYAVLRIFGKREEKPNELWISVNEDSEHRKYIKLHYHSRNIDEESQHNFLPFYPVIAWPLTEVSKPSIGISMAGNDSFFIHHNLSLSSIQLSSHQRSQFESIWILLEQIRLDQKNALLRRNSRLAQDSQSAVSKTLQTENRATKLERKSTEEFAEYLRDLLTRYTRALRDQFSQVPLSQYLVALEKYAELTNPFYWFSRKSFNNPEDCFFSPVPEAEQGYQQMILRTVESQSPEEVSIQWPPRFENSFVVFFNYRDSRDFQPVFPALAWILDPYEWKIVGGIRAIDEVDDYFMGKKIVLATMKVPSNMRKVMLAQLDALYQHSIEHPITLKNHSSENAGILHRKPAERYVVKPDDSAWENLNGRKKISDIRDELNNLLRYDIGRDVTIALSTYLQNMTFAQVQKHGEKLYLFFRDSTNTQKMYLIKEKNNSEKPLQVERISLFWRENQEFSFIVERRFSEKKVQPAKTYEWWVRNLQGKDFVLTCFSNGKSFGEELQYDIAESYSHLHIAIADLQ